ncbi:hypothetical protein AB0O28_00950 [Microbispora sp. NPDC088329]|uniref:hypothetical protein n=1 Tax=Microbispora sp. NPDC088329 TaxID=3154869 RepID=UPI003444679C
MALASALTVGAAPANAADAEILSPADGEVVKSSGPVAVSAKTDWYQISMSLYVEGPSVSRQKIATGGANQTISGSFDPGDAPNGTFTVSLSGEVTRKTYATSTFVLSRPPEVPTGVEAQLKNPTTILVSWAKGAESDLQSYEISSVKAGKSGSVSVDSACSGSSCKTSLAIPAGLGGEKVDVSVRAFRSDGTGGTVGSQRSSAAYVAVPAPKASPSPSPTPSKTPDKSAAGSQAAKTPKTHQSTAVQNPVPTLPKDTKLPENATHPQDTELPKDTELMLPEANGGSDQTEPVVVPEKTDDPKMTAQSSFLPVGGLSTGAYIALAVVLLLTGANLGAWLRRKGLTGDIAGDGQPRGSGPQPADGKADASSLTATVASGAAALTGAATAKARGATPVRRPSVILARPKARESLPETETEAETETGTEAGPDAPISTAANTRTTPSDQEPTAPLTPSDQQESPRLVAETDSGASPAEEATSATLIGDGGQASLSHVTLSPAGPSPRVPAVPAPAVPAGAAINGQSPERPLRQPEPDVWTEDDDSLYSGRRRDL